MNIDAINAGLRNIGRSIGLTRKVQIISAVRHSGNLQLNRPLCYACIT
jgi:hypothetical protein